MTIAGFCRLGRLLVFSLAFYSFGVCRAQSGVPSAGESDPNDHRPKLTLNAGGHTSGIYKLLLNGYGDQLISIGLDKSIRFWDVKTGEMMRVLYVPCGTGDNGWLFAGRDQPGRQSTGRCRLPRDDAAERLSHSADQPARRPTGTDA